MIQTGEDPRQTAINT